MSREDDRSRHIWEQHQDIEDKLRKTFVSDALVTNRQTEEENEQKRRFGDEYDSDSQRRCSVNLVNILLRKHLSPIV